MTNTFNYVRVLWCCVCRRIFSAAAAADYYWCCAWLNHREQSGKMMMRCHLKITWQLHVLRFVYDDLSFFLVTDACAGVTIPEMCVMRSEKNVFVFTRTKKKRKRGKMSERTCVLCQRHTLIIYIRWLVVCIYFAGLWYYEYESQYGYDHSYYAFIAHFLVATRMRCCDRRKKKRLKQFTRANAATVRIVLLLLFSSSMCLNYYRW